MTAPTRTKPSRYCYRTVDFRAAEGAPDDGRTLEGYAAVFDTPTEIDSWEGTFTEVIARGAFKRSINARLPVMQFDHGRDPRTGTVPIASISTLREDIKGLFVSSRLYDNPVVEPIRQAIAGKSITGMSFRFRVVRDTWTDKDGKQVDGQELLELLWRPGERGPLKRTIHELECSELGPVVFPAYEATTVGVRSMLANLDEAERAELLRELARGERPTEQPAGAPADAEHRAAVLRELAEMTAASEAAVRASTELAEATRELTEATRQAAEATPTTPGADPAPEPASTEDAPEPSEPASRTSDPPEPATSGTSDTPVSERKDTQAMSADTMTMEERASRQKEIKSRLAEIDSEHAGATLPPEVDQEWNELRAEYAQHGAAIEAQERRRAELAEIAERTEGERTTGNGFVQGRGYGGSGRQAPAVHTQRDIFDLSEIRQASRNGDEYAALLKDNARRAIEVASFPGSADRAKAQEIAERTLTQCDNVEGDLAKRFLRTGSPVYMRAFGKAAAALSERGLTSEERAALAVGVDANGGFAVPFQLDPTIILTSNGTINPLRQISRVERIVGKQWQGVTSAGVTVSRAAEGAEAADNSPTLAQPTVSAERVQGFIQFSREVEQDWNSLQSEMLMLLAEAKDIEEGSSFTLGDGTGTNAGGIVTTLTGQNIDVSTAGGGFKVPDTLDAITQAVPPRFRANAKFIANIAVYNKIGALAVAAGYITDPWVSLVDGKPSRLHGYDRYEASDMTTDMSTANSRYLVFGDFRQFLIVDQLGMSVELVPHLFGGSGRPTGQRGLYAIWRNNSKVLVPGAFRYAKAVA